MHVEAAHKHTAYILYALIHVALQTPVKCQPYSDTYFTSYKAHNLQYYSTVVHAYEHV
jgi:hypothetical protein